MNPKAKPLVLFVLKLFPKASRQKIPFWLAKIVQRIGARKARADNENYWLDNTPSTRWYIQRIFELLNMVKLEFPIAYRIEGEVDAISNGFEKYNRAVLCSSHLLLNNVGFTPIVRQNIPVHQIANVLPGTEAGKSWGANWYVSLIPRVPHYLLKAAKLLKSNKVVATYVESIEEHEEFNAKQFICRQVNGKKIYISPNLFKLAKKTQSPVFFWGTTFTSSRDITVHFKSYSKGVPETDQDVSNAIDEYCHFLDSLLVNYSFSEPQ